MFVRQNQQQFRNSNADVQIFYGDTTATTASRFKKSWNKPPGVSHVYMMLIGAGGSGTTTSAGGSGAVTVWYGAAQNVPAQLEILVGTTIASSIYYRGSSLITLLTANAGSGSTAGSATTAGTFAASGFYQSIAGQNGSSSAGINASATTFLMGGGLVGGNATGNYGYTATSNKDGFFMLQPIIVGVSGTGDGIGGIGCGGGGNAATGKGGQGMVLIASW
jgi:hypothetical protein